ncbi:hypothetical protein BDP27DRAFT_560479 [Rhodocollybia butyracea]|uniref:FAD-binding domain-containing protein n=1 Tax=Rhodocollybia butyracea TaxID=206335 RepID=A0A9P5PYQ9_9AGAR|nr:hypothetical protein BDP27DRAFT_560479 [Rhodocollybia butyracea]
MITLALALSRYPDIDVDIYESARALTEVGAGIGIFPRPWRIIKMLGIEADLLKVTETKVVDGPVSSFRYRKSDQREGVDIFTLVTQGSLMLFHRADYQQTVLQHLPKRCRAHCSKRLRSYTQHRSGPIELLFEDGTMAQCDVLIGADGVKSTVRAGIVREKAQRAQAEGRRKEASEVLTQVDPVWSGTNAYRALIPVEKLRAVAPNHQVLTTPGVQYLGKNGYILAYRISGGKFVNFVTFVSRHHLENTQFNGPWMSVVDPSTFASFFAHWEPEVQALFACVERPMQWAIHTVRPMRSFMSGRVAIIGDAAHSMTPHQGSGAGTAIEDAYILATALGHPSINRNNVQRALGVYDTIRCPISHKVMEASRRNGRYFTFELGGVDLDRMPPQKQRDYLQRLASNVKRSWEWAWNTSVDSSVQEALRMLNERT